MYRVIALQAPNPGTNDGRFDIHNNCVYTASVEAKEISAHSMSKRINIVLPDETVAVLGRVAAKGARSRFIDQAVRHFVETQGKQTLREQLKAGYCANAERDLAVAAEWFPLEEEAWGAFEASREPRKTTRAKRT